MGRHKLLLPFAGKTVIAHVVEQLAASAVERTYVVTGYHAEDVAAELSACEVSLVRNPDFDAGMLSSVRCGIRALPARCTAVLVALGDHPAVTSALIDQLVAAAKRMPGKIIVPTYRGKRGHPIIFPRRCCRQVMTQFDGVGLRGLLAANRQQVHELEVAAEGVLGDMDRPDDYRRLASNSANHPPG